MTDSDLNPATPGASIRAVRRAALVSLILAAACSRTATAPPGRGASVLLVTIDTLRADRIGLYGGRDARTPSIDGLGARGLVFEEALSSVPLTLPSHSTILSGLEPPHHGVRDNGAFVFPADRPTLATILKSHGYATGAFVGAYVLDRRFGLARGFDTYDDRIDRRAEGASVLESERRGEEVVKAASAWIAAESGPFLAWVHLYDPHAPYDPPSPYREEYAGRSYEGEVAYTDSCVGRLLTLAEAPGRKLVVALLSDHGEGLDEHGEKTHGFFVYQSTLRVPLVLAGPGIRKGERRAGPARAADVLPTILARVGIPIPAGLDGNDLLGGPPRAEAYAETLYPASLGWSPLRSWRTGNLKLIDAPRPELYDLVRDPGEANDLSSTRAAEVARLRGALLAFTRDEAKTTAATVPAEVAARLRALGYVTGGSGGTGESPQLKGVARDSLPRDPKDALPLWQSFEAAVAAEARGDRDSALALLRELVAKEPSNAAFRRNLAAALRRAGQSGEAIRVLESVARVAPEDALAWHERATALAEAGRTGEALSAARTAIRLAPALPDPHNHLGILLAGQGRHEQALAEFDEAIRLDPNSARAWNNRANALYALGRRPEATEAYKEAARLAPRDPDPMNGLGVLAVESGDLQGAATLFAQVLERDPSHAEAALNLAYVEARRGNPAAARARLQRLLQARVPRDVSRRARALLAEVEAAR
jgi:arylsulfatase A-like enzyme/Flp pilus assembly protein TadD